MTVVVTKNAPSPSTLVVSLAPCAHSKKRKSSHHFSHKQKVAKRRVSFAPTLDISVVPKHHEETWYTIEDYMEFEQSVRHTIHIIRNATFPPPESAHFTKRGLEKYESWQKHQTKKNREQKHVLAVLREQERQRALGVRNVKAFRAVCKEYSHHSMQVALEQAKRDAQHVRDLNHHQA
jgi:hypothetical protein